MQLEINSKKKFPRMILALDDDQIQTMTGLHFVWPDRSVSQVLDLSLSGIAVSSQGLVNKFKLGQACTGKVRIGILANGTLLNIADNPASAVDVVPLELTIVKVTAKSICFAFNSLTATGRMMIEQGVRDQLVLNNMRRLSPIHLHPGLQSDFWLHGPFDTNLFTWKKAEGLQKGIVEYDNLILIYDEGSISLTKSMASSDEARGYEAPILQSYGNVSMGASWLDRMIKLIDQMQSQDESIAQLVKILRAQRQN